MSNDKSSKKLGKGGVIAIAVSSVVIVVLVIVIIVMATQMNKKTDSSSEELPKRNVVVTPDNVSEVLEQLERQDYVAPGSYEVTMNTTWNFKDGKSASSNAYVENAVGNTNDVYFDITLADTEENIYSSPVLPIGSHIENITLDKELPKGSHDCVITYTLVDEDQKALSTVRVSLTIVVGQ